MFLSSPDFKSGAEKHRLNRRVATPGSGWALLGLALVGSAFGSEPEWRMTADSDFRFDRLSARKNATVPEELSDFGEDSRLTRKNRDVSEDPSHASDQQSPQPRLGDTGNHRLTTRMSGC